MIQKVFAILENKEKLCLNVFKEKTTYPTKKEKLSAKISKGRLNEFTENIQRSERKRKLPAKDSGDSPNFLSHVGVLVNVLWT